MFIKKTLFRSILIITLFTTYFISPSNGYANPNELFCSKEIIERERALRKYMFDVDNWWESAFRNSLWFANTSRIAKHKLEQHANMMQQWHDIIIKRMRLSRVLTEDMTNEITEMKNLIKAKQSKNYIEISEILERLSGIRNFMDSNRKELEKLDYQMEILYKLLRDIR
ncbi:hypothetical protein [Bartonella raoultii]|uniref:Uncharacterized protein n=1 Tax=Bartonella raoultii TaxID=1457020 RepID=A0ABS7I940_9HYPH|nr:hypothetical protein [Bartonella raoultii]MBX4335676.1 hypothetical protein [Bartonella raoultii]